MHGARLQLPPIPTLVWLCGGFVGATTTIMLFCSHFHQEDGDRAAGKLSPVVRLGLSTSEQVGRMATIWRDNMLWKLENRHLANHSQYSQCRDGGAVARLSKQT